MAYDVASTEAYIRRAAQQRGIDPDTAVRVARSEGLARGTWQSNVRHPTRGREPSYGPFQLLVGGQNGWPTGMGNDFVRRTGLDPSDPRNVNATIDFALDGAAQNGWGAWYGAAKVGVGNRDGIGGRRVASTATAAATPPARATDALEGALTERAAPRGGAGLPPSATAYASDGASPMAPRPMINVGPEKSNKLAEAMLAQAMGGGDVSHPAELIGRLAQVYAGSRQIKKNDEANADALQQALMGSGLDPAYAMAAQLGGGRDDLASAILAQQSDRTQAAQRAEDQAFRDRQFDYQVGQDTLANSRADQTLDLQRERANQPPDAPSGYQWANGGLSPIPGGPADTSGQPGFRPASAEEAGQYGATAGQFGPDGRFYPNNPPSGMSVEVGPNGTTRIVQGPGAGGGGALTEGQSKDAVFSTRARGALPLIDQFGEALTNPAAAAISGLPGGNYVVGEDFQRATQAGNEFLQAILRKDTGAAITKEETAEYGSVYLPRPGDSAATLAQKQQSRQRALAAIEAGMPPQAILNQERALMQSGSGGAIQQRDESGVPIGGMGGATPAAGATQQDYSFEEAQRITMENARRALAADPSRRDEIVRRMQEAGFSAEGL